MTGMVTGIGPLTLSGSGLIDCLTSTSDTQPITKPKGQETPKNEEKCKNAPIAWGRTAAAGYEARCKALVLSHLSRRRGFMAVALFFGLEMPVALECWRRQRVEAQRVR